MEQLIGLVNNNTDFCKPDTEGSINLDLACVKVTGDVDAEHFRALLSQNVAGCFGDIDFSEAKERGYIEIGGWIGDQGLALRFMALGSSLGVFKLLTPSIMLPGIDAATASGMARSGMVTVVNEK